MKAEVQMKELIIERVRVDKPRTVKDLFENVRTRTTISKDEFVRVIRELKDEGTLELEMPIPKADSYLAYLKIRDENSWFYVVVLLALSTFPSIYILPNTYPSVILRWVLGSMFALFLPGYVTVQALFLRARELGNIEQSALAIVLSLATTSLIGLLLNYTSWGIRLNPIVTALFIFTFGVAIVGSYRKYRSTVKVTRANSRESTQD